MPHPELTKIAGTLRNFRFPKKFAVELCADCNLACVMCHHPQMKRPKGKMPLQLWQRCADQVAAIAPMTECWFSFCGDPLLVPELLFDVLDYGHSVGLQSLNVNTNGMLLTSEVADRLIESPLKLIVIGIDGHTAETYEAIRLGGIRDELYGNVEYLLEAKKALGRGPEVQVQFIEMPQNVHELDEFQEYWLARGATVKVRRQLSWGGHIKSPLDVPLDDRIPCPWALTMMHVFWDGRVPRCPGDTEGETGAGNAWDEPLIDLWEQLGQYRNLHLDHRFTELPDRCQECSDWMTGAAKRVRPGSTRRPAPVN